jgi:Proteobacterial transcriptional regulator-like domain
MRKSRRALRPAEKLRPSRPDLGIQFIYTERPVPYQLAWYKWEFLRRNAEYRSDFKQFIDMFGSLVCFKRFLV